MKTFTSANLKIVFTYMFKGEDWQNKLLITAALMLVSFIIPILPLLALFGYLMKFVKNVIEGDGQPALPEWDDGRDMIRNGFKLLGLSLIFSLSLIILWIIGFGIIFSPFILMFMDSESNFYGTGRHIHADWLVFSLRRVLHVWAFPCGGLLTIDLLQK